MSIPCPYAYDTFCLKFCMHNQMILNGKYGLNVKWLTIPSGVHRTWEVTSFTSERALLSCCSFIVLDSPEEGSKC